MDRGRQRGTTKETGLQSCHLHHRVIAATNFSLLRRAGLSLLKNNHTHKLGVKNKRLIAAAVTEGDAHATDLASLMTLNFQRFENVSLMAA